jgi:hypothetical protein
VREVVAPGCDPKTTPVGEIAEEPHYTVDLEMDLEEAFHFLEERDAERVPVVEEGRLVGVLSRDLLQRRWPRTRPRKRTTLPSSAGYGVIVATIRVRAPSSVFLFGVCLPVVVFTLLAEEAKEGERLPLDRAVGGLFHVRSGLTAPGMDDALALGLWGAATLFSVLALVLVWRGRSRQVVFWTVAITGVTLIALIPSGIALLFGRWEAFPSSSATVAMAAVAALMFLAGSGRRRAIITTIGALFLVGYGFSLVYLGWSNPSYVVAGWCVSVAWVSGVRLAIPPDSESRMATAASLRSFARGLLHRQPVDDFFDWLRFRFDTFPRSVGWARLLRLPNLHESTYHALPWVGLRAGRRVESTTSRWQKIAPLVQGHGVRSVIDIGSSAGWFGFKLAELGVRTIAVERSSQGLRLGLYTRKKSGLDDVSFLAMEVSPSTVHQLPAADCVLLLSVWHHFVREWGLEAATVMLAVIWEKTGQLLFFETGENEMPARYRLPPMIPDARSWLTEFLADTCAGASIVHLGFHEALSSDEELCRRNLFVVVRDAQQQV